MQSLLNLLTIVPSDSHYRQLSNSIDGMGNVPPIEIRIEVTEYRLLRHNKKPNQRCSLCEFSILFGERTILEQKPVVAELNNTSKNSL